MSDFWRNLMLTVIAACMVVWTGFLLYAVKTGGDATEAIISVLDAPGLEDADQRMIAEILELFEEPAEQVVRRLAVVDAVLDNRRYGSRGQEVYVLGEHRDDHLQDKALRLFTVYRVGRTLC